MPANSLLHAPLSTCSALTTPYGALTSPHVTLLLPLQTRLPLAASPHRRCSRRQAQPLPHTHRHARTHPHTNPPAQAPDSLRVPPRAYPPAQASSLGFQFL